MMKSTLTPALVAAALASTSQAQPTIAQSDLDAGYILRTTGSTGSTRILENYVDVIFSRVGAEGLHKNPRPVLFDDRSLGDLVGRVSRFESFSGVRDSFSGRPPQKRSEDPESRCRDEQSPRECRYPPVWTRIPMALGFGLGSNGILAWGLLKSNDKGIGIGAGLCVLGVAMMLAGLAIMFSMAFPATWGWWI